jgi:hypothetical protein
MVDFMVGEIFKAGTDMAMVLNYHKNPTQNHFISSNLRYGYRPEEGDYKALFANGDKLYVKNKDMKKYNPTKKEKENFERIIKFSEVDSNKGSGILPFVVGLGLGAVIW